MLTLTAPFETPLDRVPVGPKLLVLLMATVVLFSARGVMVPGIMAAVAASVYLAFGWEFARHGLRMLRPLVPFLVILVLWNSITGQWDKGVVTGLRMMALVALANLITMTSRLQDLALVIERALAPLQRFGLRPHVIALAVALMLRFTPVLLQKAAALTNSWRARSRRRVSWRIVLPLTLLALDDADHVAEALRARGGI